MPPGKSELRVAYWIYAVNGIEPRSVTPSTITLAEGETRTSITLAVAARAQ